MCDLNKKKYFFPHNSNPGFESFTRRLIEQKWDVNELINLNTRTTLLHHIVSRMYQHRFFNNPSVLYCLVIFSIFIFSIHFYYSFAVNPADKYIPIVKLLIQNGANVDARDASGRTPIYYTTHPTKSELTKLLIDNMASLNELDFNGKSPLHEAIEHGAVDEALVLINNGANLNQTTRTGETALHLIAKSSLSMSLPISYDIETNSLIKFLI